jgi:DNA polymerase
VSAGELAPLLDYLRAIGWEEVYAPTPAGRVATAPSIAEPARPAPPARPPHGAIDRPVTAGRGIAPPFGAPSAVPPEAPADPEARAAALAAVAAEAGACTRCRLAEGRRTVVFARGSPQAELMFIGEGPGAEEDRQGLPFVGPAGQLLDRIVAAMGMSREEIYVCNVVKCRPPNNRDPLPDEVAACRGFLQEQVRLVRPRVIVALGRVAAQTLLGTDAPVGRMRGEWHSLLGVPLRVTYHPAAILRNAALKRPTWEDMQVVRDRLASG